MQPEKMSGFWISVFEPRFPLIWGIFYAYA